MTGFLGLHVRRGLKIGGWESDTGGFIALLPALRCSPPQALDNSSAHAPSRTAAVPPRPSAPLPPSQEPAPGPPGATGGEWVDGPETPTGATAPTGSSCTSTLVVTGGGNGGVNTTENLCSAVTGAASATGAPRAEYPAVGTDGTAGTREGGSLPKAHPDASAPAPFARSLTSPPLTGGSPLHQHQPQVGGDSSPRSTPPSSPTIAAGAAGCGGGECAGARCRPCPRPRPTHAGERAVSAMAAGPSAARALSESLGLAPPSHAASAQGADADAVNAAVPSAAGAYEWTDMHSVSPPPYYRPASSLGMARTGVRSVATAGYSSRGEGGSGSGGALQRWRTGTPVSLEGRSVAGAETGSSRETYGLSPDAELPSSPS